MDAQLFQEVCDALQTHRDRIKIPLESLSPINRVLWSTFDFMSGPVLKFVWEAECTSTDGGDETVDGNVSTDSSVSKNTNSSDTTIAKNQFEEIDEIFKNDLILATMDDDDIFAAFDNFNNFKNPLCPTMSTDTNSSFTLINSRNSHSVIDGQSSSRWLDAPRDSVTDSTADANQFLKQEIVNDETLCRDANENTAMLDSCVDSGIAATTSMESDLSSQCSRFDNNRPSTSASDYKRLNKSRHVSHPIRYRVGSENCDIHLDFVNRPQLVSQKPSVQNIGYCEEATEEDIEEIDQVREAFSRMTRSEHDPEASFTTSAMLNTSSLADKELFDTTYYDRYNFAEVLKDAFQREAEMLTDLNATGGSDCGMALLSDEEFVAKFALAEQLCSSPQPTSPLLHKLTTIPARRIVVGSYIFVLKRKDIHPICQTSAISVILSIDYLKWYTKRQNVVEEFMIDTISRFKAAYAAESTEDVLCRLTREFVTFFGIFAALERWPLTNSKFRLIKTTHLWNTNRFTPLKQNFLAKAITACLMTKGMCTVVGVDPTQLVRMMKTLCLFVDEKYLPFCLQPYHSPFSPYLRIQAVKRAELNDVYAAAADCHWPLAIIDIDRSSVTYTGTFVRHRSLKKRALLSQIGHILKDAGVELDAKDEKRSLKPVQAEPRVVRADTSVVEFLEMLALLPLNRIARSAYLDHFHLRIENRARALLRFVEDVSIPAPGDKRSAITAPWNISNARRALDLESDAAFAIALAKADELIADFAEFFYQTACRQAKVNPPPFRHHF